MYADDLIIFSPTIEGLKLLLHKCEKYGKSHFINPLKSAIIILRSKYLKDLSFYLCDEPIQPSRKF